METARNYLSTLYLDWINNYLSVEKFAEHNEITEAQAIKLIELMESVYYSPHPQL